MAIYFNSISDTDTFATVTEQLNNIGRELSKDNNIFTQLDSLTREVGTTQKYKLTTDTGLAKSRTTRYISEITEAGFYYITAGTFATLPDKPKSMISADTLLEVKPTRRVGEVIQQVTSLGSNTIDARVVYRFVSNESTSEWIYFQTLTNNRNRKTNLNVEGITEPNMYFLGESNTGLPKEINKQSGTLKLFVDTDNNKYYEYFNNELKNMYTGIKSNTQSSITWSTSKTNPVEIQTFLTGEPTNDGNTDYLSFGLRVYTADNISWEDAVKKKLAEGKTNFTFYCQGSVPGNPGGRFSTRGMVISDTPGGTYGVYFAVTNGGYFISGGLSASTFEIPRHVPSAKVLWKGAVSFKTTNTNQTMVDTINNYDYVEIYTKLRTFKETKGKDYIQHKAHKFYREGDNYFVCTGSILGGELTGTDAPQQDVYRVAVQFSGDTFKLVDSAINNNKTQYVTRIIGWNTLDA